MSNETVESNAAMWAMRGHGRSPALQLRHTVDDKLMIASHSAFLSFRALLHRNLDEIVLFSEEVQEKRIGGGPSVSRSLVVTNKHLYLFSLPAKEYFAPASVGGCFQLSELTRVCTVTGKLPIVVAQLVNGVVAIHCANDSTAARIADVLFSITGVRNEQMEGEDIDSAAVGASHFSRETKRHSVSMPPSAPSSVSSQPKRFSSKQSVGLGSEISSRGIDSVLREILRVNDEDMSPVSCSVACQTETPSLADAAVSVCAVMDERATSPVTSFLAIQPRSKVDESHSESESGSEFDTGDVWKSLRRPPTPYAQTSSLRPQQPPSATARGKTPTRLEESFRKEAQRQTSTQRAQASVSDTKDPKEKVDDNTAQDPQLDQFLGVLSVYSPRLVGCGMDSVAKLIALSDSEIDRVLDDANITKQGHRLLLHSKISLSKHK